MDKERTGSSGSLFYIRGKQHHLLEGSQTCPPVLLVGVVW